MDCYCVCATVELVSYVLTKVSLHKPANPYDGKYKDGLSHTPLRISLFSSFVIIFLCFHSSVLQHFVF
jgi:hypothetical protein